MTEWEMHPEKLAKLREMREAGQDFDEIAEVVGMSEHACKMKCSIDGIYKNVKTKSKPVPIKNRSGTRKCIQCRKNFHSWDKTKNQICSRCSRLGEYSAARETY